VTRKQCAFIRDPECCKRAAKGWYARANPPAHVAEQAMIDPAASRREAIIQGLDQPNEKRGQAVFTDRFVIVIGGVRQRIGMSE